MSLGQVEEGNGWGVDLDIKATLLRLDNCEHRQTVTHFDLKKHGLLVHVVISGIDNALGLGPLILCRPNCGPENALPAASGIAVRC